MSVRTILYFITPLEQIENYCSTFNKIKTSVKRFYYFHRVLRSNDAILILIKHVDFIVYVD